jgi:hypothetical protein
LIELRHNQPSTTLKMDNSTAFGILNETIKQKRSKTMDMRYHWLTDRVHQQQFNVYWHPVLENLGDYHTIHHSAQHRKNTRQFILHQANGITVLQGCVKLPQPRPRAHIHTYIPADANAHSAMSCTGKCISAHGHNIYILIITLVITCLIATKLN